MGTEPRLEPGFLGVGFGHFPLAISVWLPGQPGHKGWQGQAGQPCSTPSPGRWRAGGEKPRNWSSSSAAPHPALSWARSETSPSTWAVRRAPALGRGGYGGAGGSSDPAWASGLALAAGILPPSTQPCPLRVLDTGGTGQGKGLWILTSFPIWKAQHLVPWERLLWRGFQAGMDAAPHPGPALEPPRVGRSVSQWPCGDSSGRLCA